MRFVKDETKGIPIVQFDRSKSKMYSFIKEDVNEAQKQKELIKTLLKSKS